MKNFFRELVKIGGMALRYLLVSGGLMLVMMSLMTGKFPPPVQDVMKNIRGLQSTMNVGEATAAIAKSQQQKMDVLAALENESGVVKRQPSSYLPRPTQIQPTAAKAMVMAAQQTPTPVENWSNTSEGQRIKALEYEVALLKSQLNRARWEAHQLRLRQASARR